MGILARVFGNKLEEEKNLLISNTTGFKKYSIKNKPEIKEEIEMEKIEDKILVEEDQEESEEDYEFSKKFLDPKSVLFSSFHQNERVIEFYGDLEKNTYFNFRMILLLYSAVYFIHALLLIRIQDLYSNYNVLIGIRILSSVLIASFQMLKSKLYTNNFAKWALFITMLFSFWISFAQGVSVKSDFSFLQTFQMIEMSLTFTVVIYFP